MLGDIFYSVGTLAGRAIATVEHRLRATDPARNGSGSDDAGQPDSGPASERSPTGDGPRLDSSGDPDDSRDGELLVNAVIGSATAWVVKKLLRPRSVSWPRVVVAGIGATFLADLTGRALGASDPDRDRAYAADPDALLVRFGAGIAMAAAYAALLYPRLPGSPLTRGVIFGAMEIAAAPHGGLVRVATDTPGLKFPLKDLAVPIDEHAGPLEALAFGVSLGLLYQPDLGDHDGHEDDDD